MCLLVWHQTIWTRSAQSLEPDFGLPVNASFLLSVQSSLVYTGTCYIANTDGHWKHFTNLLLTTGCYWFAPWPCPAPTSSFENHAQEQFEGQLTSLTLCKKSSLNEIVPSIPQCLLYALFDWQHQSNSFKTTLWKYPRSGLPQFSGILLKLLYQKNVYEVNYQNNSNKNDKEADIWDKGEQIQCCLEPLKLTVVI